MAGFDAYLHLLRLVSLPGLGLRLALTSESSLLDLMLFNPICAPPPTPPPSRTCVSIQMHVKKNLIFSIMSLEKGSTLFTP